jgi:hypothetical protein
MFHVWQTYAPLLDEGSLVLDDEAALVLALIGSV